MLVALVVSLCFNAFQFVFFLLLLCTLGNKVKECDELEDKLRKRNEEA